MDMIGETRRLHRRDKKSECEISRTTGLSRNTGEVAECAVALQPKPSTAFLHHAHRARSGHG